MYNMLTFFKKRLKAALLMIDRKNENGKFSKINIMKVSMSVTCTFKLKKWKERSMSFTSP